MDKWRLIDTGLLSAAENMAWDSALLTAQAESDNPLPILRFLRFSPSCVLVGRHQSPSQEIRIKYVRQMEWDINRRITGGGTIFFDPSQIGWEVYATRNRTWAKCSQPKLYRRISDGAIAGLKKLGIDAKFRPRNDIEVDGRKISGTGGASEDYAFMFQGTLLVENIAEEMLRALRVPAEKLGRHGLESIRERVVFLDELLSPVPSSDEIESAIVRGFAEIFDAEIILDEPSSYERELFAKYLEYTRSDKWIYKIDNPASMKGTLVEVSRRKGTVRAAVQVDVGKHRISAVQFWGDFFIEPARVLNDLEALLKHRRAKSESIIPVVEDFFKKSKPHIIGVNSANFVEALARAVSKFELIEQGFTFDEANRLFFVNLDPANWQNYPFTHFLFPYCSKLVGCKFRHRADCPICGQCTVGNGYELVRNVGLEPYTITSFEHLMKTHLRLRGENSAGYIGSTCEEFFVKHFSSFKNSGLGIVLIRIDSTTCYDLSQERAAYRGEFESQTELDLPLIEKVLTFFKK